MVGTWHKCSRHSAIEWSSYRVRMLITYRGPASLFASYLIPSVFAAVVAASKRKMWPLSLESSTPGQDKIWRGMSHPGVEHADLVWPVILPGVLLLLLPGTGVLSLQIQMGQSYFVSSREPGVMRCMAIDGYILRREYVGYKGLIGWTDQLASSHEFNLAKNNQQHFWLRSNGSCSHAC